MSSVVAPPGKEVLSKLPSLFREDLETQGAATAPLARPPRRWRGAVGWKGRIRTPDLLVWHCYFSSKRPLAGLELSDGTCARWGQAHTWGSPSLLRCSGRQRRAASRQSPSLVTSSSRSPRTSALHHLGTFCLERIATNHRGSRTSALSPCRLPEEAALSGPRFEL